MNNDSDAVRARPRWWVCPLSIFLAARLGLWGVAWLLVTKAPAFASTTIGGVVGQFCEYDCLYFVQLAKEGYGTDNILSNFFPGFFLLVRLAHWVVPVDTAIVAVVVANAASLISFLVMYRLFTSLADETAAGLALALFAFYPFAFFQASGYPESLAVLMTAAAIWFSLRNRPWLAAFTLAGGVLVRHVSALAGLSLLGWELERAEDRPALLWRLPRAYALLLPVIAIVGYSLYCASTFGDPISFLRARSNWGANAWRGVDLGVFVGHSALNELFKYSTLCSLPLLVGAIALVRHKPWRNLGLYGASLMLTIWLVGVYALGRYSASCWPAFLPLGVWLKPRPVLAAGAVGFSALLQVAFFFLHNHRLGVL